MTEITDIASRLAEISAAVERIKAASIESADRETRFSESVTHIIERIEKVERYVGLFEGFMATLTEGLEAMGKILVLHDGLRERVVELTNAVQISSRDTGSTLETIGQLQSKVHTDLSLARGVLAESRELADAQNKSHVRIEQRLGEIDSSLSRIRVEIPNISEHVSSADRSAFALKEASNGIVDTVEKLVDVVIPIHERIMTLEKSATDLGAQVKQVSQTLAGIPQVIQDVSTQATVDIAMQILKDLQISAMLEKSQNDMSALLASQMGLVADYMRKIDRRMDELEDVVQTRRRILGPKK